MLFPGTLWIQREDAGGHGGPDQGQRGNRRQSRERPQTSHRAAGEKEAREQAQKEQKQKEQEQEQEEPGEEQQRLV